MSRFVQFTQEDGSRALGRVAGDTLEVIAGIATLYELAQGAIAGGVTLEQAAQDLGVAGAVSYGEVASSGRLLPAIDHPDSAHLLVTGTGLTHTGSADARDGMHAKVMAADAELSDSMKIFKMGIEGGRPADGEIGVQPEWFWKGNGNILRASGETMQSPHWADDMGEEPEIAGIYLIGPDGTPFRLGFALANEMSDHVMERVNYLFLAHSKLRECSVGPELLTGALPDDVQGTSRIYREGEVIWEKPFLSGEANMTHSIANLEHHHFKYPLFCQPGDIHVHVFGTATLSFVDGIRLQDGDEMEIHCPQFGRALRNKLHSETYADPVVKPL
ncbi:MAG: AraD1 family protein [Sulfitobacter sp.]